jgi:hypothetical protein
MIDHNATEIALRFGRKLAEADRYLAYYEVHDEAMRAAYHHGVLDSELGRFCLLVSHNYAFCNPLLVPTIRGHA